MDAIQLLKSQHREVEDLFAALEKTTDRATKRRMDLFSRLADALAIHARIEETLFYPAANGKETEDMLLEALEEHLVVKRLIADVLELEPDHSTYMAKVTVLKEMIEHHVKEEESDLFKKARKALSPAALKDLGARMEAEVAKLAGTDPRLEVPAETREASPLGERKALHLAA